MSGGADVISSNEDEERSPSIRARHVVMLIVVFVLAWGVAHQLAPMLLERGGSPAPESRVDPAPPTREELLEGLGVDLGDIASGSRAPATTDDRASLRALVERPHPSGHELLLLTCEARQFRSVHAVATGPTTLVAPLPSATVAVAVRAADGTWWGATIEGRDGNGLSVLRTDPGAGLVAATFSDGPPSPGDVLALRAPQGRGDVAVAVASSSHRRVSIVPQSSQDEGFVVTDAAGQDLGILRASDGGFEVVPVVASGAVVAAGPERCEGRGTFGPQAGVTVQQIDGPTDPVVLDLLISVLTASNQRGETLRPMLGDEASRDVVAQLAERSVWDVRLATSETGASGRSQPGRILRAVTLQAVEVDVGGCWIAEHRLVVSLPMFASGSRAVVIGWSADTQDRRPCPAQD